MAGAYDLGSFPVRRANCEDFDEQVVHTTDKLSGQVVCEVTCVICNFRFEELVADFALDELVEVTCPMCANTFDPWLQAEVHQDD